MLYMYYVHVIVYANKDDHYYYHYRTQLALMLCSHSSHYCQNEPTPLIRILASRNVSVSKIAVINLLICCSQHVPQMKHL